MIFLLKYKKRPAKDHDILKNILYKNLRVISEICGSKSNPKSPLSDTTK
jgi:predicted RNase H-like nuclease